MAVYFGDKGRRVLWRPKDHVSSHTRSMVRLVRASGDYIRLDNESWSDHYTQDVRYGKEDLYQAFQFHKHHLHRHEIKVR